MVKRITSLKNIKEANPSIEKVIKDIENELSRIKELIVRCKING